MISEIIKSGLGSRRLALIMLDAPGNHLELITITVVLGNGLGQHGNVGIPLNGINLLAPAIRSLTKN
jgi:hypothetical protein